MHELSRDPRAYVRASPSRGVLGGLARYTLDVMTLCESGGHDVVVVETIGLGQVTKSMYALWVSGFEAEAMMEETGLLSVGLGRRMGVIKPLMSRKRPSRAFSVCACGPCYGCRHDTQRAR